MLESERVFAVLAETGVLKDPSEISQVLIVAKRGQYTIVHVERIADEQVLDVARSLQGPLITEPAPEPAVEEDAVVLQFTGKPLAEAEAELRDLDARTREAWLRYQALSQEKARAAEAVQALREQP